MTSIQERLQLKREPIDKWSIREQLCLASAVARSGDQNWVSVARALKPFGDPNRPQDWFSQKNCAAQYGALLGNVETPKRKKRQSGADAGVETPAEAILRRLLSERQIELKKLLAEEKAEYQKLHEDMLILQSGKVTEEQLDKWCKEIDEEEQRKEQEAVTHAQWLKEREIRKQEIERAWRPVKPAYSIPGQKRKSSDTLEGLIENEQDDMQHQNPQNTPPVPESPKPALSPLLTSLLKSPSQVQNVSATTSSILHTAITNQRVVPNIVTNPTISSLLNSSTGVTVSPGLQQLVSTAIGQDPGIMAEQIQPLAADILDDAHLPNLKIEDLANSILVQDGPLPEIKKEEVDDIISEIIENAQDIVDDPEQHLQLDGNGDININLELEDLEEDEVAEVEIQSTEPKELLVEVPKSPEKPKEYKPEKLAVPEVDPFEFKEDPIIFESIKPTTPVKDSKQYIPQYQQMQQQLHQHHQVYQPSERQQQQLQLSQSSPVQQQPQQQQQHPQQQQQQPQQQQQQPQQQQQQPQQQQQQPQQLQQYQKQPEQKAVAQEEILPSIQQQEFVQIDPQTKEPEIPEPQLIEEPEVEQVLEETTVLEEEITEEVVTKLSPKPDARSLEPDEQVEEDVIEEPIESKELDVSCEPLKSQKKVVPGSVEIVEVVMEDLECSKELNKTQIQDIVHSVKSDIKDEDSVEIKLEKPIEDIEEKIKPDEECPKIEIEENVEEKEPVNDVKDKTYIDINSEEQKPQETTIATDFNEELYDNISMEVKIDKTGKTKRDYSRTKKKEEKGLDVLLAIEKAHLEDADFGEETIDNIPDLDKKDGKLKKVSENERSSSPWTEEEDISNAMTSVRRYSTPATPVDSVPNSPASSVTYDDDRDYRNWKKSVMLVYNRLATNKYASLFLKPITEDQAPGYSSIVYRPMDLQTIKKHIESGAIRTTLEFKREVMLMFTNAIMYNKTDDTVYNMAKQMQEESISPIDILMQAQGQISMPSRRETRTSESSSKRKRPAEENVKNKKRKDD